MEHFKSIQKRCGVDVGYHNSNIMPDFYHEGCVGVSGINKTYSLAQVMEIAYKMKEKPNIIVKRGPNGKWYFKKIDVNVIEEKIQQQKWREGIERQIMYIIEWDE
jgi:hypothetical protein